VKMHLKMHSVAFLLFSRISPPRCSNRTLRSPKGWHRKAIRPFEELLRAALSKARHSWEYLRKSVPDTIDFDWVISCNMNLDFLSSIGEMLNETSELTSKGPHLPPIRAIATNLAVFASNIAGRGNIFC